MKVFSRVRTAITLFHSAFFFFLTLPKCRVTFGSFLFWLNDSYCTRQFLDIRCKLFCPYSKPERLISWLPVIMLCMTCYYLLLSMAACRITQSTQQQQYSTQSTREKYISRTSFYEGLLALSTTCISFSQLWCSLYLCRKPTRLHLL